MTHPRRLLSAVVAVVAATPACAVSYQARRAPLGDPGTPALRVAGVTAGERQTIAGAHEVSDGNWAWPTVTGDGLQNRAASESETTERTVLWTVRVQAAGGQDIDVVDMTWSPASAPRCSGGHPALEILLDLDAPPNHRLAPELQVHWERPVVIRRDRTLAGRFDEDRPLLGQPSVVDVRLSQRDGGNVREVCVRVPATGPDVTYWSNQRWSLGGRFAIRRALAFSKSAVATWAVSGGRWIGPVRVGVEGMLGGTDSPKPDGPSGTGLCFVAPGPDCDRLDLGGGAVEASGIAWRWSQWAIGWSLSYEALFASVHHLNPGDGTTIHRRASAGGARLGVQVLRVPPTVVGASRFGPTSAWGIEVFGAAAQEWTGAAAGSPVTFGVSLLGF